MIEAGISPYMLNCVFSDSESLYVYGGSNGLRFSESESLYSVMSSPLKTVYPISGNQFQLGVDCFKKTG